MSRAETAKRRTLFDEEALVHLNKIHSAAVYLTKNAAEAEDLTQETFLKAYRHFDKYTPGTNCRAWLYRIMHNTFYNSRRKKSREVSFIDQTSPGDREKATIQRRGAHTLDPEASFMLHTLSDTVIEALGSLPDDFREAVVLCDLQELSYREIADIMDCPMGTVMSRIYRGRQLLQRRLMDHAVEQGILQPSKEEPPTSLDEFRLRQAADGEE